MGPDQPPTKTTGTEVVRSLGGLWTVGEGSSPSPDPCSCDTIMTLGYDPAQKKFVGTFVASVMTHLWHYSGTLNEAGNVLTLDTEGPSFTGEGMTQYQDIIEFIDDSHRTLTSRFVGPDGKWHHFMTAHYRRVN
jgi:hypothetical protein